MVMTMASPMPIPAIVFPFFAESGWLSLFRPTIKSMILIRYKKSMIGFSTFLEFLRLFFLFLEHMEHSVSNCESANNIDHGKGNT